jgi:ATPase subunit of ABC transporter with duplicated ATPase domains
VGLLAQEPHVVPTETVAEQLARRTGVAAAQAALDRAVIRLSAGSPDAGEAYDRALDALVRLGAGDLDARTDEVLARLGLEGRRDQPVVSLSGGQRARAELAALLLSRFDVLLLDEPTNDVDLDGLALLEEYVTTTPSGVAVVSHDRAFLERVTTAVLELDLHTRTAHRYPGGFAAWRHEREVARRHEEERFERYTDERDRLLARARRHREWARSGAAKAKRRPVDNDKVLRKKKMEGAEGLAGQAARAERALERLDEVDKPWDGWELRLRFTAAERSGTVVASLVAATVELGAFRLGPVDLEVRVGDRVVITGANGSGKTTLLRALLGEVPLVGGQQRLGAAVVIGRLDQAREELDRDVPLLDAVVAMTGADLTTARSELAKLGLGSEHVERPAARLSPGERTRAVLATFVLRGVNLLVLDEPTNHLDLPAIEQLEAALDAFPGTLLLVSHDRRLLDAVRATRRLVVADGRVTEA